MANLVTLTSDFGTRDPYVAELKAAIITAAPEVQLLDLCHEITPGDVREGAFFLLRSVPCFPEGTVHLAVVDPGVGSDRQPLAVQVANQFVVCPDNGLLTLLARDYPVTEVNVITNSKYMRPCISPTFHGRDIFAPAAAALASGVDPAEMGATCQSIRKLNLPLPVCDDDLTIVGEIIHIDHFGNLITNIRRTLLGAQTPQEIRAGKHSWPGLSHTYSDVGPGQSLVLFGSSDYLEIAVRLGNAATALELNRGAAVEVCF